MTKRMSRPRVIGLAIAVSALAGLAPATANAAGWDVEVRMFGAGAVSGTDALACTSTATAPTQPGGTCGKHYAVHPRICVPFVGCVGGPDPRPIEFAAHPRPNWDQQVVWSGCDGVAGNVCTVRLPFPGLSTVKSRTVTVSFTDRDRDDDGHSGADDCDDLDPRRYKGALEIPDNGVDENCDSVDGHDPDQDHDGYLEADDCNDHDPRIHPGARDIPRNGIDEDCRDGDNRDADGDGYDDPANTGKARDCNDANPVIHPGAVDVPDNGIDENCDGRDAERPDRDGDGYARPADCADDDPSVHPTARDKPRNHVDEDCDGKDADFPAIPSDIAHSEKGMGSFTVIRRLTVMDPPDGATIKLACRGERCPFRRKALQTVPGTSQVQLARYFRGTRLARGMVVEVAVTTPGMYGKVLRLGIRKAKPPRATWFKVDPVTGEVTAW